MSEVNNALLMSFLSISKRQIVLSCPSRPLYTEVTGTKIPTDCMLVGHVLSFYNKHRPKADLCRTLYLSIYRSDSQLDLKLQT